MAESTESLERWEAVAGAWEAEADGLAAASAPVTAAMLAALRPGPDDVILELAGGTGELAEALAPRVARFIYTDFSPAMVEVAKRRATPGVEHRVVDMQAIDLPDASVDGIICRYGYMLVPDPALAMRETRRVLRPGGRVTLATWAAAAKNPWATRYGPVLVERGLMEPPPPGDPGQFALSEPKQIESLVRAAGFEDVGVEEIPVHFRFEDWEDYRDVVTSLAASLRQTLSALDEKTRAEVDEAARARFEPFSSESGYRLPGVALVARAV